MLFKTGLMFFKRKVFFNLIIILQISVTILLTNLIVGSYNAYNEAFELTKKFPPKDTCFLMQGFAGYNQESRSDNIKALIDEYKNVVSVEQTILSEIKSDDGLSFITISYGQKTSTYMNMLLKKGCWFTEAETGDFVPCVVKGKYKVGDIIRLPISYKQENIENKSCDENSIVNRSSDSEKNQKPVYVSFKVTGLLKDDARILTFATSSNNLMLEYLFDNITEKDVLLFNQEDLKKFDVNTGFSLRMNSMLYMQTSDENIRNEIINKFKDEAWVVPFKDAHSESKTEFDKKIKIMMPLNISLLLIGLASVFCITLLNAYNNIRVFSIYYICGMNWKSSFLILISYVLSLVFCSVVFCSGIWFLLKEQLETGQYVFNGLNVVIVCAVLLIVSVVALAAPYFLLKKEQPLKQLKQGW